MPKYTQNLGLHTWDINDPVDLESKFNIDTTISGPYRSLDTFYTAQADKVKALETNYTRKGIVGIDFNDIKDNGIYSVSSNPASVNGPPGESGGTLEVRFGSSWGHQKFTRYNDNREYKRIFFNTWSPWQIQNAITTFVNFTQFGVANPVNLKAVIDAMPVNSELIMSVANFAWLEGLTSKFGTIHIRKIENQYRTSLLFRDASANDFLIGNYRIDTGFSGWKNIGSETKLLKSGSYAVPSKQSGGSINLTFDEPLNTYDSIKILRGNQWTEVDVKGQTGADFLTSGYSLHGAENLNNFGCSISNLDKVTVILSKNSYSGIRADGSSFADMSYAGNPITKIMGIKY